MSKYGGISMEVIAIDEADDILSSVENENPNVIPEDLYDEFNLYVSEDGWDDVFEMCGMDFHMDDIE